MLLMNKSAVIYGGGGAIGGAVARAFAREGARIFLAGRTRAKLEAVAQDIRAAGGEADAAVDRHADDVAEKVGGIDIALNAVGFHHVQGTPFTELSLEDFSFPITAYTRSLFITARAAARHMAQMRPGVILVLSTPGSRLPGTGYLGYGVTCAAKEAFSRLLAAELAPSGIRVLCIRPHAIPEAAAAGSHAAGVFRPAAERAGLSVEAMLAGAAQTTLLKRLPTLDEVAGAAVFAASDRAGAMTGTILNLSCGLLVD